GRDGRADLQVRRALGLARRAYPRLCATRPHPSRSVPAGGTDVNQASESIVPRLAVGVRLKFDEVRGCWVILAPERGLIPDETAVEILRRCAGLASLSAIIDELSASYDASRELIAQDVCQLVAELTDKGILRH